jgi:hypothetical protein
MMAINRGLHDQVQDTRKSFECRPMIQLLCAGVVGFGTDMGATRSLANTDAPGQAMEITAAAMQEADCRITDPLRKYRFWRKVRAVAPCYVGGRSWACG